MCLDAYACACTILLTSDYNAGEQPVRVLRNAGVGRADGPGRGPVSAAGLQTVLGAWEFGGAGCGGAGCVHPRT